MKLIKRHWKPGEADDWTREDWITIIISSIVYILLTIGIGLSLLLQTRGFIILGAGILLTILMHWIIDPKLKSISTDYEARQKEYLIELEKTTRWEDLNG